MKKTLLLLSLTLFLGAGCTNQFAEKEYIPAQPDPEDVVVVEQEEESTFASRRDDIDMYINYSPKYGTNILYGYDVEGKEWFQVNQGDEFYQPIEIVDGNWLAKGLTRNRNGKAADDGVLVRGSLNDDGTFQEDSELINVPGRLADYLYLTSEKQVVAFSEEGDGLYDSMPGRILMGVIPADGRITSLTDRLEPGIYGGYLLEAVFDDVLYYRLVGGDGGCWFGTLYAIDVHSKEQQEIDDIGGCHEEVGGKFFYGMNNFYGEPTYFYTEVVEEEGNKFNVLIAKTISGEVHEWQREVLIADGPQTYVSVVPLANNDVIKDTRVQDNHGPFSQRTVELLHSDKNLTSQLYSCTEDCPVARIMTFGSKNNTILIPGHEGAVMLDLEDPSKRETIVWPEEEGYYAYQAIEEN